jgi:ABC-type uncharacterized transport system substrate-binding protein
MIKSSVVKLLALLVVGLVFLSGCSTATAENTDTGEEKYRIGISQLTEHPA